MKTRKGFTLLEITICIIVFALLVCIAAPDVIKARRDYDRAQEEHEGIYHIGVRQDSLVDLANKFGVEGVPDHTTGYGEIFIRGQFYPEDSRQYGTPVTIALKDESSMKSLMNPRLGHGASSYRDATIRELLSLAISKNLHGKRVAALGHPINRKGLDEYPVVHGRELEFVTRAAMTNVDLFALVEKVPPQ